MGYQPRIKSPKGAIHGYKKPLREKRKDRKRLHRRVGRPIRDEKHTVTEREVSEITLKRLHTLGIQKFGSSPFCEHFDRWLTNVTVVLNEFESYPNMGIDNQFVRERSQTLASVKLQLENRRRREASLNQEIRNLSVSRSRFEQIKIEYVSKVTALRGRKNSEVKHLNSTIDQLKKEQEKVIRMKTGFFQGISRKDREQREIAIADQLSNVQRQLELVMLDFNAQEKNLQSEYERKREPVLEQLTIFKKRAEDLEEDGSLEDRWFACEALIDAVNAFLQRKATQPQGL
jgi:hypothetical protein